MLRLPPNVFGLWHEGAISMRRRVLQVAVAALLLLTGTIGSQTAASAADPKPHGGGTLLGKEVKKADINSKALVSECDTFGNPDPQFSASNSTLHWGLRTECTGSVASQSLSGDLYTVVGNGDNQHNVWQDFGSSSSLTWYTSFSIVRSCILRVTGRWTIHWHHTTVWANGTALNIRTIYPVVVWYRRGLVSFG